jgi:hypothetical protein
LLDLLARNIAAETTSMPPRQVAAIALTFFSGLCIEMNLDPSTQAVARKVGQFMKVLKSL